MPVPPPSPPTTGSATTDPESALPPVGARVLAFVSILLGGLTGGLIGAAFARLGGFGSVAGGLILLGTALLGAGGVAVVAVLTLRAFGEWETARRRQALEQAQRAAP
ncbi:MAG: hypothetical protein ACKO04_07375 [Actinomycetes bacterium]